MHFYYSEMGVTKIDQIVDVSRAINITAATVKKKRPAKSEGT